MGASRFCSKDEIKTRAGTISFTHAWLDYQKSSGLHDKSCTYSLETRKFYDGDEPEDRKDLLELYGDGGPLYIIAPWTNPEERLSENKARIVCKKIVGMGYIPFIGVWYFEGRRCEEPSFAINHGIIEEDIQELLVELGQVAACRVSYDRVEYIFSKKQKREP